MFRALGDRRLFATGGPSVVSGLGIRKLEFGIWISGLWMQDVGFRIWGSGFWIRNSEFEKSYQVNRLKEQKSNVHTHLSVVFQDDCDIHVDNDQKAEY